MPAREKMHLSDPVQLVEMGRFNHEAVAVDPQKSIVYQTEDASDGLIYRYIPNKDSQLARGGKLPIREQTGKKETPGKLELSGATFHPSGKTLFFNIQHPGITLALTGPWKK